MSRQLFSRGDRPVLALPARAFPPVLLVGLGGTLGTAARYLLSEAIPHVAGVPLGILAVNLSGAFLLGVLLEMLAPRGADGGGRRSTRLFLGTGVLGGYTTYSALAADSALLLQQGHLVSALLYALGTVILGAGCSLLGILLGRRLTKRGGARA